MSLSDAVYPSVPRGRGHYESFYLKAAEPAGGRAVWLRHTIHKRPGEEPAGSVWCTVFDHAHGRPVAVKESFPAAALAHGGGALLGVGESRIAEGGAVGGALGRASWTLAFDGAEPPFPYLPSGWMYRAPIPRTKAVCLRPGIHVSGTIEVDGRRVDLDGWPGMVGHNWGAEHAERWLWLHAAGFAGRPDAWFDAVLGRIRVGGRVLPWIANGCLALDGHRHRLGGPARLRTTHVEEHPTRCAFTLPGAGVTVQGSIRAPSEADVVVWRYADPEGPEHHTANCSIADVELDVGRPGLPPERLVCRGGGALELGMREQDHGLPVEPFPDP